MTAILTAPQKRENVFQRFYLRSENVSSLFLLFLRVHCRGCQFSVLLVNLDHVPGTHAVGQNQSGCQRLHVLLQIPLPSAPSWVVAVLYNELLCAVSESDGQLSVGQTLIHILHQKADNASDIALCQRLEHDNLVQTV